MTGLLVAGTAITAVLLLIGISMINEGDGTGVKTLGTVIVMVAGAVFFYTTASFTGNIIQPDRDECSQYVYVVDTWKCVPHGQEG